MPTLQHVIQIGGAFRVDQNELNGWGSVGAGDDNNTQDLGDVTAYPALNRSAGGLALPFDATLVGVRLFYRTNRTAANNMHPWGWVITRLDKTDGGNAQTEASIISEIGTYPGTDDNTNRQTVYTEAQLSAGGNNAITAGQLINLAVAGDPAGGGADARSVQVEGGYFQFEYEGEPVSEIR